MDSSDDTISGFDSGTETPESSDTSLSLGSEPSSCPEKWGSEDEWRYQVLSTEEIVEHMADTLREVSMSVQVPPTTTRMLLNHFKWDLEKFHENYYDGNTDKLLARADVVKPSEMSPKGEEKMKSQNLTEECGICLTTVDSCYMSASACEHRFCAECWDQYLTTKIVEEGIGETIACAAHGCNTLVDGKTVMRLITDPKVKLKYQHLIRNSFVDCNRFLRWCPKPGCTNAIKVNYVDARSVTCKCGHVFCFACGENWHDPVECSLLKRWQRGDDTATSGWIAVNTKECPKCHVSIEKAGGCNYMSCKNQNCKTHFCWICLGLWEDEGYDHECNRFEEEAAKGPPDGQKESRGALKRYLFYYDRYQNHMQSLRFENKLHVLAKQKMDELMLHNMSWIEVQFMKTAVDVLCQCRQTLMYTYVFAYYLKTNNQSIIFGDNQSDLERATEKLSEFFEKAVTAEYLLDIKQKVQDMYRYCDSRRRVLSDHVHEGYENDSWEYDNELMSSPN